MNRKFQLLIGATALVMGGCTTKYYIPNTQNVPMISQQGQTNLSFAGNGNQVEFQGAYGISDAVALQANAGFVFPQEDDNGNGGSGKLIEGGLGYYNNLTENWLFDTYGLLGVGNMENDFPTTVSSNPSTTGKISASILRFGLQPSIGYHNDYFSIALSTRVTSLNYSNIKGSLVFGEIDQVAYLEDNKSNFLIEPALTIRGGFEKLKLQLQFLKSFNLSHSDFKQDDTLLSVGVNFNFR